jgi:hypothetical protein
VPNIQQKEEVRKYGIVGILSVGGMYPWLPVDIETGNGQVQKRNSKGNRYGTYLGNTAKT